MPKIKITSHSSTDTEYLSEYFIFVVINITKKKKKKKNKKKKTEGKPKYFSSINPRNLERKREPKTKKKKKIKKNQDRNS